MSSSSFFQKQEYHPVADEEQLANDETLQHAASPTHPDSSLKKFISIILCSLVITALCGASFFVGTSYGKYEPSIQNVDDVMSQPGSIPRPFLYNGLFSSPPSNSTDGAWLELFPPKKGFLNHLTVDKQRGSFAVFHQLHCLQSVRLGYYTALSAMNQSRQLTDEEMRLEFVGSPTHVRHCIDYIRQSLMCHADTNIEPVVQEQNSVVGFGSTHYCRNYDALKERVAALQRLEENANTDVA
ncbi:hypothetical protein G7Y89_g11093 [Cudoniella acicularis]|uniref:Uncharacterized protein n=1 Tax=Cudoniella acicularis TaxID=354080 RepID=A0A8H4RBI5_9HELO|nr:hypothetical protein G7Y89_g11093 [Cudoniella acicularis]